MTNAQLGFYRGRRFVEAASIRIRESEEKFELVSAYLRQATVLSGTHSPDFSMYGVVLLFALDGITVVFSFIGQI